MLPEIAEIHGMKYGEWEVVGTESVRNHDKRKLISCKCSCGTVRDVKISSLKKSYSRSCGCKTGEMHSAKRWRPESPIKYMYSRYKTGNKRRKLESLDFNLWLKIASQPCKYCGSHSPNITYLHARFTHATRQNIKTFVEINETTAPKINGIDRVDSSLGYLPDNCVACCTMCNEMKLDYPLDKWMTQMKKIIANTETAV